MTLILKTFETIYRRPAIHAAEAPGRVNLIGEHIDYLGGLVLPIAIPLSVRVAAAPAAGKTHRFFSAPFCKGAEPITPTGTRETGPSAWINYPLGVIQEFERAGHRVPAMDFAFEGDLPPGSGLSSSAALAVATAMLLNQSTGAGMTGRELAKLACRAENDFAGIPCGIMDQAASVLARKGMALRLACGEFSYSHVPIPEGAAFIVAHSGVERKLGGTKYQERRTECAWALATINEHNPREFKNLCEVPIPLLDHLSDQLAKPLRNRARFALAEQARVKQFCLALERNDLARAGELMAHSHEGLRDLYEVSCKELDELVDRAQSIEGVYGSRLTGAGFGGCTISLVDKPSAPEIARFLAKIHPNRGDKEPLIFIAEPSGGARVIEL